MMTPQEARLRAVALHYLQRRHPLLSMRIAAGGPLNGMGDFWSDLRDKALGNVKESVKAKAAALTDKLKGQVAGGDSKGAAATQGALSNLVGPSTATALYNIYRIQTGKQPVQVADVVGASKESQALRFIPIAIATAIGAWGLKQMIDAWRGN